MEIKDLSYYFDLSVFKYRDLFSNSVYVFDFLRVLEKYINKNIKPKILGKVMRGAFVGKDVFLGKGSVIQPGAWVNGPAFIGHSILGNGVNLGAGTKLSNLKVTMKEIEIEGIKTGLSKIGAFIGDGSSLGCNTVTHPATFIGKNVMGYPLALLRGFVSSETIVKVRQNQEEASLEKR